jgi:predicted metal-binding membrane protein
MTIAWGTPDPRPRNAMSGGLAVPAVVALSVLVLAALSLALLAVGEAGGWLTHGARPAAWSAASWIALFLAGWVLMTGAMMLPASLPFLDAVARVGGGFAAAIAGLAFSAVWFLVGVLICGIFWASGSLLAGLAPGQAEQLAGGSLVVAGVYQASPLASACQRACATPFAILARHWHGGAPRPDAAMSGLHYGLVCVGCCLPVVLVMLLLGVHDVFWTLALALVMAVQKNVTFGARLATPFAVILLAAGIAIAVGIWRPELVGLRVLCGV